MSLNEFHNITIGDFSTADTESVKSLVLSIVETELRDLPPDNYLDDLDNINYSYSGSNDGFWVAKIGDEVVGTIAVKEDGGDGMIRRFFVNPNYRSIGIGRKLIDQAIVHAREHELKNLYFVGNTELHKARKVLINYGFTENEVISLGAVTIFKLQYPLSKSK